MEEKYVIKHDFGNGFTSVLKGEKCYIIDKYGNLLSNVGFDYITLIPNENLFSVCKNEQYNFLKFDGNLLSDIWFDDCYCFFEDGVTPVYVLGKGWNVMRKNDGSIIFDEWYTDVEVKNHYIILHKGNEYNYSDINGNLLFDKWTCWETVSELVNNNEHHNDVSCESEDKVDTNSSNEPEEPIIDAPLSKVVTVNSDKDESETYTVQTSIITTSLDDMKNVCESLFKNGAKDINVKLINNNVKISWI